MSYIPWVSEGPHHFFYTFLPFLTYYFDTFMGHFLAKCHMYLGYPRARIISVRLRRSLNAIFGPLLQFLFVSFVCSKQGFLTAEDFTGWFKLVTFPFVRHRQGLVFYLFVERTRTPFVLVYSKQELTGEDFTG